MPKEVLGYNYSATQIRYAPMLPEQLPTMLLLGSIGYDSSLAWISHVHATTILSNRGDIYYMSATDLMGIGTLEETC